MSLAMVMTFGVPALRRLREAGGSWVQSRPIWAAEWELSQKQKANLVMPTYLILFLRRPPRTHLSCYTGPSGKTNLHLQHSWSFQGGKTQDIFPVARVSEPVCQPGSVPWELPDVTGCQQLCRARQVLFQAVQLVISRGPAAVLSPVNCRFQSLFKYCFSEHTQQSVWPGPVARTERPHRPLIKNTVCWPSNTVLHHVHNNISPHQSLKVIWSLHHNCTYLWGVIYTHCAMA